MKRLVYIFLTCSMILASPVTHDINVLLDFIPEALAESPEMRDSTLLELERTAQLHPNLLFHHLAVLNASYADSSDSTGNLEELKTQYMLHRAVAERQRWSWEFDMARIMKLKPRSARVAKFTEGEEARLTSNPPRSQTKPAPLDEAAHNRQSFFAYVYLSGEVGQKYDDSVVYDGLVHEQYRRVVQEWIDFQTSLQQKGPWSGTLDPKVPYQHWYLFDQEGKSLYPDLKMNFPEFCKLLINKQIKLPKFLKRKK